MADRPAPTGFVALLRGINVGRAKPVAMDALRDAVAAAGYDDVKTILRSGNVVLRGHGTAAAVAEALEANLDSRLGLSVTVIVRTAAELAAVISDNPLADKASDGSRLHVSFLGDKLSPKERDALRDADFGADRVLPANREIYVWYADGMSGSDTATRLARMVTTPVTARNWNTVTRIRAALDA
jgi:uncharacterized protein (DUF1697 family)